MAIQASYGPLVPCQQLDALVRDLADTPYPVLILGPTGSGKSTLAKYIHASSRRQHGPFVECAVTSIPDELRQAELLGSAKGSFTGAYHDRAGLFEQAHTGTLFLDELGHASLRLQQTLLGVLETGTIRRIGDVSQRAVDVRIICATSADLAARTREGSFLEELLYRVECLTIELASLRERRATIVPLAVSYLREAFTELERDFEPVLSKDTAEALRRAHWPGNMRQLRSVCQYVASRVRSQRTIQLADLPALVRGEDGAHPTMHDRARAMLAAANGNKSKAARLMGVSRPSFYKLLTSHEHPQL